MVSLPAKSTGPHPSKIHTAAPYVTQGYIDRRLFPPNISGDVQLRSAAEAREDRERLLGVTYIDQTRRALHLPVRTYTTACTLYHKFRLAHPGADYLWTDGAAASLLASCKIEDTLKKSRDILAAAWNLKNGGIALDEQMAADDTYFDLPSRTVIGVERLVLEASGFDFRSKYPHNLLVRLLKSMGPQTDDGARRIGRTAWTVLTDLGRTFAFLKQTSATLAIASIELAARIEGEAGDAVLQQVLALDLSTWATSREEIAETLLDALDLYTQHATNSILGTKFHLNDWIKLRLVVQEKCDQAGYPRYTEGPSRGSLYCKTKMVNGHPTPVSPTSNGHPLSEASFPAVPEGGGTLRFMLNPVLAADETAIVQRYFIDEWEEYEEEVDVTVASHDREGRDRYTNYASRAENRRPPVKRPIDDSRDYRDRDRDRDRVSDRGRDRDGEWGFAQSASHSRSYAGSTPAGDAQRRDMRRNYERRTYPYERRDDRRSRGGYHTGASRYDDRRGGHAR
ncbi:hypothetical protein K470DRAFT_281430 [Piedraia hortae CBS 480.64]|uniref:Cyclin-like protein n=1 Tax=Piedraia hortae CBS 480.64 TaxID=1314780 RepID=A0A6A7C4J6_9PEZI|nr:hypothetical protein K470DRAFT_281430 [Piedraia hortae CBS 480.64]